jgi:hypothetical protein
MNVGVVSIGEKPGGQNTFLASMVPLLILKHGATLGVRCSNWILKVNSGARLITCGIGMPKEMVNPLNLHRVARRKDSRPSARALRRRHPTAGLTGKWLLRLMGKWLLRMSCLNEQKQQQNTGVARGCVGVRFVRGASLYYKMKWLDGKRITKISTYDDRSCKEC